MSRTTDPRLLFRAQQLFNEGLSGAAIAGRLQQEYAAGRLPVQPPTARGVQAWIEQGKVGPDDLDMPWRFVDTPDDAPLILPVVRAVLDDVAMRGLPPRRVTRREADWIASIRRAAPDLEDTWTVFYMARLMGTDPAAVDVFLVYAPWRDGAEALAAAVRAGTVPLAVADLLGYDNEVRLLNDPHHPRNRKGAKS